MPSAYLWQPGKSCNTATVLGLRHEGRSTAVDAALIDFGSDHSFDEAATIFERHYKFKISDATIRRITESTGEKAEQFIKHRLAEYENTDEMGTSVVTPLKEIFAGFDGCSIRTGTLEVITPLIETAIQAGEDTQSTSDSKSAVTKIQPSKTLRTASGRLKCRRIEEWKDVRLGFVRELGNDIKKLFVRGMIGFPDLMKDLFNLGLGLGMNENTKPIATSDGGNGLYEELDRQFNDLQFILDYFHFKEHLYDTAKEKGLSGDTKDQWVNLKADLAWEGRVDELINGLKIEYEATGTDRIRQLVGYIERFKKCIS